MRYFIFRNNTVENIFGNEDVEYSGYEDISRIPQDADSYLWMYQVPIKFSQAILADEIAAYAEKLDLVISQISQSKNFVALTLVNAFPTHIVDTDTSVRRAIADYNSRLYALASSNANVKVVDFEEFTSRYPQEELIGWKFYFISQMYLSPKLVPDFRTWFEKKMADIALKRKKCIVLDLDNTLWGGVLGEEGVEGIKIGGDYPGKAFLYFQSALKQLAAQGVILAVCSKNNEADVIEVWEKNPFLVLRRKDFAAYRINWNDKATNIVELSKELNIGLDSMVFVDDNPTERELIRQALPMIAVPEFPKQPYMLPQFFMNVANDYFKVYDVTDEDKRKTVQYKANAERNREQARYSNFEDFLRSLQINIVVEKANQFNITRIAQMTQKTNQFNLTTKRYTDADVRLMVDQGWLVYCISVSDRFGDNGITGAIFIEDNRIDNLLLSCRILGKGIEAVFLKEIVKLLLNKGLQTVTATYIPTKKNAQVSSFYDNNGFTLVAEHSDGMKSYSAHLSSIDTNTPDYYKVSIKE